MHDILSDQFKNVCREIDTVTVKGSIQPMRLFTVDIRIDDLVPSKDPMHFKNMREKKFLRYKLRKALFQKLFQAQTTTIREFNSDYEITELRRFVDEDYEARFKKHYR